MHRRFIYHFVDLINKSLSCAGCALMAIHVGHTYIHSLCLFCEVQVHSSSPDFIETQWHFGPLVTGVNSIPVMLERSGTFLFSSV